MRKMWIVGGLILFLLGCAAVKQAKVDATICLQDPICREEAINQAKNAKEVAVAIGGVSPIPLSSNVVGGIAYGIVFLYALVKGGQKKREEETPTPIV